jgi:uncharacterized protein YkwD
MELKVKSITAITWHASGYIEFCISASALAPALITISLRRLLTVVFACFLPLVSRAAAVTLLPQEQAIANDLTTDPNQGRPYMVLDPVIQAVAEARAKDMAVRNYFSHVNPDGVAANYLLRQAGYQLPAWWGTDPTANYVESIAAGYSSPSDTWTQWMDSPPHKEHLLAQNSFFATETHYGVGYYYDPNSTYQYYWVVITAPPQPIEIMTPASGTQVTGTAVAVTGMADPSTGAATVEYRVENTTGTSDYQQATGLANWSGTATGLEPGHNVIRAESLDGSGNLIAQTTCGVNYIVPTTLSVAVSGSGSVTAAYAGVTAQHEGSVIAIKATPAAGSIFTGWTGSLVSANPTISFVVEAGMSLQANFEPSPFVPAVGAHFGVITSGSGAAPAGLIRVALSVGGAFTGHVTVGSIGYSFSGILNPDGEATVTIPVPGQSPLVLTLQADLTGGTGDITGTLTDGGDSYGFVVSQATYNATTAIAPEAGRYTVALSPDPNLTGSSAPQGNGYATILVYKGGMATVTGCLADGTPYSALGHVANDGTLAIFCVPSGAPAGSALTGLLTFQTTDVSDVSGTLSWTKGANASAVYYPAGFSAALPCVGSRYTAPAPASGLQAMDVSTGEATAAFGAGNLPQALTVPVVINQSNQASMVTPGAPNLNFAINPVSGTVNGTFVMPDGNLMRAVRGVVIQKQQTAFGYFRGVNQCGYFSLAPGA